MKNNVTPQTAFRLKAAGFPQPQPEFGQVWANESIHRFIIDSKFGEGRYNVSFPVVTGTRVVSIDPCAYCPDATDIMREMEIISMSFSARYNKWYVGAVWGINLGINEYPAEAAAMAWLAQNENKSTEQ